MDEIANGLGYGVLETIGAMVLTGLVLYAMMRWPAFAKFGKITFLMFWGVMAIGAPIAAVLLSNTSNSPLSTCIGAAAFLVIAGGSYRYLGWPELIRTLKQRDA